MAGEVDVLDAKVKMTGSNVFSFSATLKHTDDAGIIMQTNGKLSAKMAPYMALVFCITHM